MRRFGFILFVMSVSSFASAQSESVLRQYFEGMTVVVKLDMPATQYGVDVYPGESMSVDFRKVAQNLKTYGTGVHAGQSIMVTKVHVKKKNIEFQLGGGGFGTFADNLATSSTYSSASYYQGKSKREKNIEDELKWETDPQRRKELKEEQDDLRRERSRDNSWSSAQSAQAKVAQAADERARRAQSGSRFNIRYHNAVPPEALTPDGIVEALSKFLDFPAAQETLFIPATADATETAGPHDLPEHEVTKLKKGLTLQQVEQLLGPAGTATTEAQGSMEIMTRTYSQDDRTITTKFVGGILIEFAITST